VDPEVEGEAPPVIVRPAEQPQEQNPEQVMVSLRRAQEALQNDDRKAAMQSLMQAEEQLDQSANARLDAEP
jgi:F0F1-type ATP synthase epsilon subunit